MRKSIRYRRYEGTPEEKRKEDLRKEIEKDIEHFLKNGNKIKTVEPGATGVKWLK